MRSNGDYAFVRATRMARLQLLIGGEILREEKLYYLRGDKVLFQHFCATVDFVRNTSKGQILTVSTKILGKTIVKDVSSQGVELVSLAAYSRLEIWRGGSGGRANGGLGRTRNMGPMLGEACGQRRWSGCASPRSDLYSFGAALRKAEIRP